MATDKKYRLQFVLSMGGDGGEFQPGDEGEFGEAEAQRLVVRGIAKCIEPSLPPLKPEERQMIQNGAVRDVGYREVRGEPNKQFPDGEIIGVKFDTVAIPRKVGR